MFAEKSIAQYKWRSPHPPLKRSPFPSMGRQKLKQLIKIFEHCFSVRNDTEVSNLKDGCVLVCINSNDKFGFLHTSKVLDSSADTECKVCLGTNSLTCLTNLTSVFYKSCVNECTRSRNCSVKFGSKFLCRSEVLNTASARNENFSIFDISLCLFCLNLFKNCYSAASKKNLA